MLPEVSNETRHPGARSSKPLRPNGVFQTVPAVCDQYIILKHRKEDFASF